ncbi:DUF2510 domain-containing protein [Plantactinospora sp. B6F1]|uniref:DUF2510 domain-containing protein n=1 Tax=Plantactinospora sp. B6F1 TaxID=3158971 RepID=UPI0032D9055A
MRPGWYPDPSGRYPLRWFDGTLWTPQALDGWQRPVVDPLPAVGEAATLPPGSTPTPPGASSTPTPPGASSTPASSPASSTPASPGAGPASVDAAPPVLPVVAVPAGAGNTGPPATGTPPGTVAPVDQGRWLFWLTWRMLLLVVALGLLFIGFVVLPWGHILRLGMPPITVHYFDFVDWVDATNVQASGWQRAYAQGVGLLHAFVAFVATATTIAVSRPGRHAPWAGLLQVLLFASLIAVHFGTPHADIEDVHPGGAGLAVFAGIFALFLACPGFETKPKPASPAR